MRYLLVILAVFALIPLWAADEALVVDASGNVGIGTDQPSVLLHVKGTGNYPTTLQVDTDATSGEIYPLALTVKSNGTMAPGFTGRAMMKMVDTTSNANAAFLGWEFVDSQNYKLHLGNRKGNILSNSLTIDQHGNVGIGLSSPVSRLQITAKSSGLYDRGMRIDYPGGISSHFGYGSNYDTYIRSGLASGKVVLQDFGGNVGIGTSVPTRWLHVVGVLNGPGNGRSIMGIDAGNTPDTNYKFLTLRHGATTRIELRGDGVILANGYTYTSDRELKEGFSKIDTSELCKRIVALPITTWRYKSDSLRRKHIGPMAQDVKKILGIGSDGKSVNLCDMTAIAMVAAKEVILENRKLKKDVDGLAESVGALKAELGAVKTQLASVLDRLDRLVVVNGGAKSGKAPKVK